MAVLLLHDRDVTLRYGVVDSDVVKIKFEVLEILVALSAGENEAAVGAVTSTESDTEAPPHGPELQRPPDNAVVAAVTVSKPVTVRVALLASVSEVGPKRICEVSLLKTVYGNIKQLFVPAP